MERNNQRRQENKLTRTRRQDSIESVVRSVYPSHEWVHERFVRTTSRSGKKPLTAQLFLERIVRTLFLEAEIRTNARAAHGIVGPTGVPLEIDVYLPALKLGFEYQVYLISNYYFCFVSFLTFINKQFLLTGSSPLLYY